VNSAENTYRSYFAPDEICLTILVSRPIEPDDVPNIAIRLIEQLSTLQNDPPLPLIRPRGMSQTQWGSVLRRGDYSLLTVGCRVGNEFDPNPVAVQKRKRQITELVATLNSQASDRPIEDQTNSPSKLEQVASKADLGNVIFAVAMPNLLSGARSVYTGGGPGSDPEPVDPDLVAGSDPLSVGKFAQFYFPDSTIKISDDTDTQVEVKQQVLRDYVNPARKEGEPPSGVTVAVLDTWPSPNWLMNQFFSGVNEIPIVAANHSYNIGLNSLQLEPIADHGLFAAGIIKDIAPTATVRPVRVLDQHGVGTWADLVAGLMHFDKHKGPLVINLSLGLLEQAELHMLDQDLQANGAAEEAHTRALADRIFEACRTLQLPLDVHALRNEHTIARAVLYFTFALFADYPENSQRLIVAAAGNDAHGAIRPEPDIPARYESVISVAAITTGEAPSNFSSLSDVPHTALNGIAVLGGSTTGGSVISPQTGTTKKKDAVVGLFSAGFTEAHKHGWAYWAGTSFAAPIISALAADIWATNLTQSASDVRTKLLALGQGDVPQLGCQLIIAEQDIKEPPLPTT
jgi:subtilisin family serine protease